MKPTFSIVMPVYNARLFLKETINSVLSQNETDFELIIIDDNSLDDSVNIINQFSDPRIHLVENEINKGVAYNRNRGLELASGQYIIFMDHDDIMPSNRLKLHRAAMENAPDTIAFGGKIVHINENGNQIGVYREIVEKNPVLIAAELHSQNPFINSSVTYRVDFLKMNNIRYWDHAYGLEDYVFLLTCSKYGKISAIDEVTLYYRRHSENTEKKLIDSYPEERIIKWKEIFAYSFDEDGICIEDNDLDNLNMYFREGRDEFLPTEKYYEIRQFLYSLLSQHAKNEELQESLKHWANSHIEHLNMEFKQAIGENIGSIEEKTYHLGKEVSFNTPKMVKYLVSGFGDFLDIENPWTCGTRATMRFDIVEELQDDIFFEFGYDSTIDKVHTIIKANGIVLDEFDACGCQKKKIKIPVGIIVANMVAIEFCFPDVKRVCDVNPSNPDERELALLMSWIKISK